MGKSSAEVVIIDKESETRFPNAEKSELSKTILMHIHKIYLKEKTDEPIN